jgi:hypothetical protein
LLNFVWPFAEHGYDKKQHESKAQEVIPMRKLIATASTAAMMLALTAAPAASLWREKMRTTKLLLLSVAALLFMTACQSSLPGLPGVDTGDTSVGLDSDPLISVAVNATVGIEDTIVQVPASIAANVCGVDVNVLVEEASSGSTPTCTATSSTSMEQLQPYAQEGQLQPTQQPATEPPTTDTSGQQSAPQQESAPGKSEEAPKKTG